MKPEKRMVFDEQMINDIKNSKTGGHHKQITSSTAAGMTNESFTGGALKQ